VFLDTGYHFDETLTMRDAVAATYRGRINLITVSPEQTVAEQDAEHGRDLFASNPDRCCFLRKVLPLDRALAGYDAWGSGLRRDDSIARSRTHVVDWDRRNGMVKVNPLARWTQAGRRRLHRAARDPHQPLLSDGFASVGCFPCTRRTGAGEEARAGRWAGQGKNECGIHLVGDPAMTAPSYPLVLGLAGRRAVVVGGGPVAARRTASLVEAGADVLLVAPWVCEDLHDLVESGAVTWVPRDYTGGDLDGAWLVHTATGDPATDDLVAAHAEGAGSGAYVPTTRPCRPRGRPRSPGRVT
jgi:phosphoadenosine phosphosulfate reductase